MLFRDQVSTALLRSRESTVPSPGRARVAATIRGTVRVIISLHVGLGWVGWVGFVLIIVAFRVGVSAIFVSE